ncbi:hypothetical protein F6R83_03690 [Citrobacter amalonaticus]|nr:hypothetical protein [Citrobacter amalonaticus]
MQTYLLSGRKGPDNSRPTGVRAVNSKAPHSTFLERLFPENIANNLIKIQRIFNDFKILI